MDPGLFTVSGVVPSEKYFICTNSNKKALDEQNKYIENESIEFVVTYNNMTVDNDNYELIKEINYTNDDIIEKVKLYQRK